MSDDDLNLWKLTLQRLAQLDLKAIDEVNPRLAEEIVGHLQKIRCWDSPLTPRDRRKYNAILSYPNALGCVRIKQWGGEWRIVLRVLCKDDKSFVDLRDPKVKLDKRIHYLQVIFINLRSPITYYQDLPDRMLELASAGQT